MTKAQAESRASALLAEIEAQQEIQKRNRPTSAEWNVASDKLRPMFAEMAGLVEAHGLTV